MERSEAEKPASEDASQLNRNRSFKSKQLVRSQAIRESTSPPRTISPAYPDVEIPASVTSTVTNNVNNGTSERSKDECSSVASCDGEELKKQPVEIQITGGGSWDDVSPHRQRSGWAHHGHHSGSEPSRELLSNNPRVTCVCGAAAHCPHCRGRRRRPACPSKQDSGIACADDCPDCAADSADCLRKSESLEVEEQTYYCRCPERKEKPKNTSLSRTDSDEKSEPTGVELVSFIKETLNKNARDRATLLKIEKELHALVNDTGRCMVRFPVMTSYGRMLVHRCAALFQLSHHLDQTNKTSVLVSKTGTSRGRIPCTSFKQWCTAAFPPSPQRHQNDTTHAKSILKRETHSLDEPGNGSLANSRSKSLEQRERDYERMKRKIFSTDNCTQSQDESQWPWLSGPVKLLTPETGRNKLLKVQSLESGSGLPPRGGNCSRRGVSKSHSFGGYAQPAPSAKPFRLLSRQGDLASSSWRLSPSSSGYKTLSLRSTDSVTPSPTGGASPEPCFGAPPPCPTVPRCVPGGPVVWCVTDMSRVPPGAWLLHPQTLRPLANPDGSVYRFDPNNPPVLDETPCKNRYEDTETKTYASPDVQKQENHSNFEPTQPYNSNEVPYENYDHYEQRFEAKRYETTNHRAPYEAATNQKAAFETPANHRTQQFETTNQRAQNEQANKLTNQDSQEIQYNQYGQGIRTDEVTSPPQNQNPYQQTDMNAQAMAQTKTTPVPMPDPNLRPMTLNNVVYPTMPQGYPYMNQCRMEQPLQQLYQQPAAAPEDHKQLTASPHQEPTFRIDPSYPYAAVDYAAQCGACVDPNAMRGYNVSYGQVEMPQAVLPPAYPLGNVLLPQPHLQHYPYQEPVQWTGAPLLPLGGKLMVPEPYPALYHQLVRTSLKFTAIPLKFDYLFQSPTRRNSDEIAVKIQQIKEQMAELNTRDKGRGAYNNNNNNNNNNKVGVVLNIFFFSQGREEWRKRNNGSGILGSYPHSLQGRTRFEGRPSNDETQLSSAARAIVNSIRNMQAKNTNNYHENRRTDYNNFRSDRPDYRRRDREPDNRTDKPDSKEDGDRRFERRNAPFQYRPPYLLRQVIIKRHKSGLGHTPPRGPSADWWRGVVR
ncbi:hypothetical protein ABMA28_011072 [Loxostege sticticalis]|uniref:Protein encore n=1 Tax=Loxostege sticticalis TaxID=481309 RepID=A0ABD0S9X8_LOXSC